jgi:hypothetical protein
MWNHDELSRLYEDFKTKTREAFLAQGRIYVPSVMLLARRHPDTMLPGGLPVYLEWAKDQEFGDRASREALKIQIRVLASRTDALALAMVMEVWFKHMPKDAPPVTGSIEEDPARQEALLLVFEPGPDAVALGFEREDLMAMITRDAAGRPELGECKPELGEWTRSAGGTLRDQEFFEGMLPEPKPKPKAEVE